MMIFTADDQAKLDELKDKRKQAKKDAETFCQEAFKKSFDEVQNLVNGNKKIEASTSDEIIKNRFGIPAEDIEKLLQSADAVSGMFNDIERLMKLYHKDANDFHDFVEARIQKQHQNQTSNG